MLARRYETIIEMLQAHVDVLLQHCNYIRQIEAKEISDDDVKEYVFELFGYEISNSQEFIRDYLPVLKQAVNERTQHFLHLLSLARNVKFAQDLSVLYLALQFELLPAEKDAQMVKRSKLNFPSLVQTALNRADYLKMISRDLHTLLHPLHKVFDKYITVEIVVEKIQIANETYSQSITQFRYGYLLLTNELETLNNEIRNYSKNKHKLKPTELENIAIACNFKGWKELLTETLADNGIVEATHASFEDIFKLIDMMCKAINSQLKKNNKIFPSLASGDRRDIHEVLKQQTRFFEILSKDLDRVKKFRTDLEKQDNIAAALATKLMRLKTRYEKINKDVNAEMKKLTHAISSLRKQIEKDIADASSGHQKYGLKELLEFETINAALQQCEYDAKVFSANYQASFDEDYFQDNLADFNASKAALLSAIDSVHQQRFQILHPAPEPETAPVAAAEPIKQRDEKREAILAAQKKANQARSATVKHDREQKKQEKAAAAKAAAVVAAAAVAAAEPKEEMAVLKNVNFEECLLNMSPANFDLLVRLLNLKRGVKYDEVCNLIVNQLGGEVKETGGGSSHKIIRIDKYFVEISASELQELEDEPEEEPEEKPAKKSGKQSGKKDKAEKDKTVKDKATIVTGGMFKKHGKAHEPGTMGKFNMKLVLKTFIKAGITPALLDEIEAKRRAKLAPK